MPLQSKQQPARPESATGDRLLTVKDVAAITGLNENTLNRARMTGTLNTPAFVKIGSAVRYKLSTVQHWIESQQEFTTTGQY